MQHSGGVWCSGLCLHATDWLHGPVHGASLVPRNAWALKLFRCLKATQNNGAQPTHLPRHCRPLHEGDAPLVQLLERAKLVRGAVAAGREGRAMGGWGQQVNSSINACVSAQRPCQPARGHTRHIGHPQHGTARHGSARHAPRRESGRRPSPSQHRLLPCCPMRSTSSAPQHQHLGVGRELRRVLQALLELVVKVWRGGAGTQEGTAEGTVKGMVGSGA